MLRDDRRRRGVLAPGARVSGGRVFVFGVLLVPVALTFLWLAVLGKTVVAIDRRSPPRLAEIEARVAPLVDRRGRGGGYGGLAHLVVSAGRQPRRRAMDLLIAATAQAHGLPLDTRDPGDLAGVEDELTRRIA